MQLHHRLIHVFHKETETEEQHEEYALLSFQQSHTYIHTYVHTYIHTYIHIYTYIRTFSPYTRGTPATPAYTHFSMAQIRPKTYVTRRYTDYKETHIFSFLIFLFFFLFGQYGLRVSCPYIHTHARTHARTHYGLRVSCPYIHTHACTHARTHTHTHSYIPSPHTGVTPAAPAYALQPLPTRIHTYRITAPSAACQYRLSFTRVPVYPRIYRHAAKTGAKLAVRFMKREAHSPPTVSTTNDTHIVSLL